MKQRRFIDQDYETYLGAEWDAFSRDSRRAQASLDATTALHVARVLDIGCGAGQELRPFVLRGAFGVGADVAPEVAIVGPKRFAREGHSQRVVFLRSAAENLPFRSEVFDVVVCRLALPYTANRLALAEIARTLRSGGILLLKIHHALFYIDKLFTGHFWHTVYGARVLIAGALYHLTGKQVRTRLISKETYQTRGMLALELARTGLRIVGEMPDSNPRTPSFVIKKQ